MGKSKHQWVHVLINRSYPKSGICEFCNGKFQRTEWSNKQHDYKTYDNGERSLDIKREEWQELCSRCHRNYDIKVLGLNILGKRSPRVAQHGTTTQYISYKCRCDLCREAIRIVAAKRRAESNKLKYPGVKWGTREQLEARLKTYAWYNG